MEHQQAEKCLKKKSQKLNLPGYVNKCVQSWYKSNDNILSRTYNTKRKERLINWEKLKDVHFTSTSRLSILIALNEEANLRPAKEVCFFFFFFSVNWWLHYSWTIRNLMSKRKQEGTYRKETIWLEARGSDLWGKIKGFKLHSLVKWWLKDSMITVYKYLKSIYQGGRICYLSWYKVVKLVMNGWY